LGIILTDSFARV